MSDVETLCLLKIITSQIGLMNIGVMISPVPSTQAFFWCKKHGTSHPICLAIRLSCIADNLVSYISLRAIKHIAAFELPPPSPPPIGIFFFN